MYLTKSEEAVLRHESDIDDMELELAISALKTMLEQQQEIDDINVSIQVLIDKKSIAITEQDQAKRELEGAISDLLQ